ncbi:hypothetical protein GMD78_20960 [Ornithinibacillus sp. L9]|uniref:Uncharacterized protein n=1 Tax=Ornithinibacillus caprae TaxID=2678566 RepID=A0A6N8FNC1_9BACI|nr:hypothetical protein [Ornithinibacillus caprae]
MKQKISFVGSLFHHPKLIILDEPFTAMDKESTLAALDHLDKHKALGGSLIFSSHQENVIKEMTDSKIFLKDGKIIH